MVDDVHIKPPGPAWPAGPRSEARSSAIERSKTRTRARRHPVRLAALAAILAVMLVGQGLQMFAERWRFSVNLTESLPNWAFVVDLANRQPQMGDLIAFVPPPTRWYGQGAIFTKRVAGRPGDVVTRRGRAFYVSGRFVGYAKERAHDGSIAEPGPTGVIPPGRYFVVADHVDSLDSRYAPIGWIAAANIVGVARAVL